MGYYAHHAVVITGWPERYTDGEPVPAPWTAAVERFRSEMPEELRHLFVGPVASSVNYAVSFALLPDGSKEGWDTSNQGDALRRALCALARRYHLDFASIRFGGDDADLAAFEDHDGKLPERV